MTMQIPEVLIFRDESYALCSLPLDVHLANLKEPPPFYATPTCLERMYVGMWKIEDDKLYLIHLSAKDRGGNPITMQDLFPNCGKSVWANWYSGTLRCPTGKRLRTIPLGFESVYDADLLLTIENGALVGVEERQNPPPSPTDDAFFDIPEFLKRRMIWP